MKKITVYIAVSLLVALFAGVILVANRETGYIKVEYPGYIINLQGGLWKSVTIGPSTEPKKVHVGTYMPSYANYFIEENGDKWQLYGPWRNLPKIQVVKEETISLKYGPPFQIKTDVRKNRSNASIGLSLVGRAEELYSLSVRKNGQWLPAPKLKIIDEAENILAEGRSQYG